MSFRFRILNIDRRKKFHEQIGKHKENILPIQTVTFAQATEQSTGLRNRYTEWSAKNY